MRTNGESRAGDPPPANIRTFLRLDWLLAWGPEGTWAAYAEIKFPPLPRLGVVPFGHAASDSEE